MWVRLGVLMAGDGVGALGAVGVMRALAQKDIAVHAVCGMGAGAYPAALWACAMDAQQTDACLDVVCTRGARLLDYDRLSLLRGCGVAATKGTRIARLLLEQTRGLSLSACERRVAFLCMAIPARRTVAFSPESPPGTELIWTHHAPVWFAARAALGAPPLVRPASFVGVPVCAHPDAREGIHALYALGATHIAAVYPVYARAAPRQLSDLTYWENALHIERALRGVRCIRIMLPEYIQPLTFAAIHDCVRAGKRASDAISLQAWEADGGRIVPFRI